jgi:hypothetical protein
MRALLHGSISPWASRTLRSPRRPGPQRFGEAVGESAPTGCGRRPGHSRPSLAVPVAGSRPARCTAGQLHARGHPVRQIGSEMHHGSPFHMCSRRVVVRKHGAEPVRVPPVLSLDRDERPPAVQLRDSRVGRWPLIEVVGGSRGSPDYSCVVAKGFIKRDGWRSRWSGPRVHGS